MSCIKSCIKHKCNTYSLLGSESVLSSKMSSIRHLDMVELSWLRDYTFPSATIVSMVVISLYDCGFKCKDKLECMTFSFHSDTHQCDLLRFPIIRAMGVGEPKDNTKTYSLNYNFCPQFLGFYYYRSIPLCYKHSYKPKLFPQEAIVFCKELRARFIHVDSIEKEQFLKMIMEKTRSPKFSEAFVGGQREYNGSEWYYGDDGTVMTYKNFVQPPIYPAQMYVRVSASTNYGLQPAQAQMARGVWCELPSVFGIYT